MDIYVILEPLLLSVQNLWSDVLYETLILRLTRNAERLNVKDAVNSVDKRLLPN
jgi:hypothetical protein